MLSTMAGRAKRLHRAGSILETTPNTTDPKVSHRT